METRHNAGYCDIGQHRISGHSRPIGETAIGSPSGLHNRAEKSLVNPLILGLFVVLVPAGFVMVLANSGYADVLWSNSLLQILLLGSSSALAMLISRVLYSEARANHHPAILTMAMGFAGTCLFFAAQAVERDVVRLEWLTIESIAWVSIFCAGSSTLMIWRAANKKVRMVMLRSFVPVLAPGLAVFACLFSAGLLAGKFTGRGSAALTGIPAWLGWSAFAVVVLGLMLAMRLYITRGAPVLLSFMLGIAMYGMAVISRIVGGPLTLAWWLGAALEFASLLMVGYGVLEASRLQEYKRAEVALRDSEERYRLLFESSPYPLWVRDMQTLKILAVNQATLDQYGYTREEFLALSLTDLFVPEDIPELEKFLAKPQSEDGFQMVEYWRHKRKDGTIFHIEVTAHRLIFAGRPAKIVLVHDITEQKKLEEQLRQSQKMEAVGRLAGGVAHDFNNLLGVIIGYSEILESSLGESSSLQRKALEIKKAGNRAAALTRQLLAFSRQQVLEPRVLDLNAVVTHVEKMLRRLIGEDVALSTSLAGDIWNVKADQSQIEQVIMNLAVNSRDAMPQGGKLTIETANIVVDELYARQHPGATPGAHVMLAVTDTGCGMDAETQAHMFEPFFTTKDVGKGTGLGLATVYGVVKQSNGHIFVYSEPGKGTTIKIFLPRDSGATVPSAPSKTPAKSLRGSETVLLVEDAESLRKLTSEILQSNGYTLLEAADGEEAIARARQHRGPIQILLTDVVMPGMNGRTLAEKLTTERPEMNVLFMSGYTDLAMGHQGILEEGSCLLQKPFTQETLLAKLREVTEISRRVPSSTVR